MNFARGGKELSRSKTSLSFPFFILLFNEAKFRRDVIKISMGVYTTGCQYLSSTRKGEREREWRRLFCQQKQKFGLNCMYFAPFMSISFA
mmetsp:Transcript_17688/g.20062  ORF Transcript_17688/g.20062 Transcript_17688/m.20062 type:complete len:90 (-) Transcript_17688:249-518(-)